MTRFYVRFLCLALTLGCAQVQTASHPASTEQHLARFLEMQDRLQNVAIPLLVAAAEFCQSHVQLSYGFDLDDRKQYSSSSSDSAGTTYELDEHVRVRYVHPTLSAGMAGLRAGARVLSIDDITLEGRTAADAREIVRRVSQRREGPLHLLVQQTSAVHAFDLNAVPACEYPVHLVQNEGVNAFADGKRIAVTTGMMRLATSDAELALVLGHEIAHNTLGHSDQYRLRSLLDALVTAISGHSELPAAASFSFPKELEADADYVGLYVVARAGYDIEKAGQFWARLLTAPTGAGTGAFAHSHPPTPDRLTVFRDTVQEIHAKKDRQEPLLPQIRHKD